MNMLLLVLDRQWLWASQGINGNVNVKTRNFMKPKNLKNCQVCQVTTYVFRLEIKSHVQTKPKTLPKYFTHDFLNLSRIFTLTEILTFCVETKFESPSTFPEKLICLHWRQNWNPVGNSSFQIRVGDDSTMAQKNFRLSRTKQTKPN